MVKMKKVIRHTHLGSGRIILFIQEAIQAIIDQWVEADWPPPPPPQGWVLHPVILMVLLMVAVVGQTIQMINGDN